MENTVLKENSVLPETDSSSSIGEATIPCAETDLEKAAFLTVKFNKELIRLDEERAVNLAQKGMKYEQIAEEFENLKAAAENKSADFEAICQTFPEISSPEMLPCEVLKAAENSNRGLFLEYLLYRLEQKTAAESETENQKFTAASTTGSLSADDRQDPATAEFLRGVWGR